jgi:hypothetical protein
MTVNANPRQTIIAPEPLLQAVNDALSLAIRAAGWVDGAGVAYGAASLLPEVPLSGADLPGMPVRMLNADQPLTLTAGHVHIVSGMDGAVALDHLGLSPLL